MVERPQQVEGFSHAAGMWYRLGKYPLNHPTQRTFWRGERIGVRSGVWPGRTGGIHLNSDGKDREMITAIDIVNFEANYHDIMVDM